MKITTKLTFFVAAICIFATFSATAGVVDKDTARTVATNWIQSVIAYKGHWNEAPAARVSNIVEFKRGARALGYYCEVEPSGYVLVSLVEGLAPVKAFSTTSRLDPDSDEGMADVLKLKMQETLDIVEKSVGPVRTATRTSLAVIPGLDKFDTWDMLKSGPIVTGEHYEPSPSGGNYQQSEILMTSRWHQGEPFYNLCPVPGPGSACTYAHCAVGCVAPAAAQIARYWSWPPGRDWLNMPDQMFIAPTAAEIAAVSELSHTLGVDVGMDYCSLGDCGSGAPTSDMVSVYGAWGLGSIIVRYRSECSAGEWWDYITGEVNQNRPIQYRIVGHSIVCDGWWYMTDPMVHMNYGWSNSRDDWYVLDNLYQPKPEGSSEDEYMLLRIYPWSSFRGNCSGTYSPWHTRYVDQDCWADSADFEAGNFIQFLNRKVLTCHSGWLNFYGLPGDATFLYCGDDSRGVRIDKGYILMKPGASIRFALSRPD